MEQVLNEPFIWNVDGTFMTLTLARVGSNIKVYQDDVLKTTLTYSGDFDYIILTNNKLTTYNGNTAKWDYIKIVQ